MVDDKQMGRSSANSSKSIPPPPPPPPPPLPPSSSNKPAPSLAAELSTVSLKHRPPPSKNNVTQSNKSVSNASTGPFRLPPASTLKKVRPPLPPSSSTSQHHPSSGHSNKSVDPLLAEISAVSLKPRSTQGKNCAPIVSSVSNDSAGSFRLPTASTLPKKLRPPLPPPPPPSVPPSGFSNNSSKFVPPPPPSQASSNNVKKPALPPKKIINTSESNSRPLTSVTNLESRFRHIFKDLHTLPAPEPFLSTKKQYPSERKPRGPAPPIPSRSTSISNTSHNELNNFNSSPMIHVQLEHQAVGVNYPRY